VASSRAAGASRGLSFAEQERALTPRAEPRWGGVQTKAEGGEKAALDGSRCVGKTVHLGIAWVGR